MKIKKVDRRVSRTRQFLHEALLSLILEKGYEAITVQDIIDRANVGRSTFYAHFYDKRDLLQNGFQMLKEMLTAQCPLSQKRLVSPQHFYFSFSLIMFEHAREYYRLYQAFVGKQSGAMVQEQMLELFRELVREELEVLENSYRYTLPLEVLVYYISNAYMSLLNWWLDHDMPYPTEKMDQIFHTLILPSIQASVEPITH
ncbi:TetR/AcrR family transcriptional regulator [Xylanibacillus composti]|uniref:TetR family transcriptional regulator n=1 Tax=Xylanibacillus composti TaxID=1572762 RepID=A0A8J4H1U4_9BACL|nr:TetR/AcrR family transcriptional regulator [Xylanibacillus composti]MDT9726838.1 TetR/AcrR family transcriptional regulator [Xylanibacillus composti]GIQ67178.1 TetR family transcriptional regulator [Xylanibacillus composti]